MRSGQIRLWHVLALALACRLLTFALLPYQDFPDARSFTDAGQSLLHTGQMQQGVDIYMPLYPIWNFLWGGGWGVKFGDILLSTGLVAALWYLSILLFNDRILALLTASIAAVYPHFLFFAVSGLTETMFSLLVVLAYIALYRERFLLGSVILILSILVRPAIDLLAPVLILWFALIVHRRAPQIAVKHLARYALVYVLLMSPWWLHNYMRYGEFVRLNLGDGIVLFSGNNELNQTGGGVGYTIDMLDMDVRPFLAIANPIERNEAYKRAAWDYIKENPGRFVELAGMKFTRFWRLWPFAPAYAKPELIAVSLLSYGVVLASALVFLARSGITYWRPISPILLLSLFLTLIHMVTIGSVRYRFPLEPFLIVLGAFPLAQPLRRFIDRQKPAAEQAQKPT